MTDPLSFTQITLLALADSVNPCELAILSMILITLLIQNPQNKKRVLFGGLAFVLAVFIGYLAYGLLIIEFFKYLAEFLRENSLFIYDALAVVCIIIGGLNIKDYFAYKPGNFATEMPLSFRPRVKMWINKITSPIGAFFIGFVVTLFLLPCTMGPYIVASGLLANLGIIGAIPWLLYYNLIFVLPMIVIVFMIYFGFKKVEDVSGWKERNIRYFHLIAGILLVIVGLAIFMRWI